MTSSIWDKLENLRSPVLSEWLFGVGIFITLVYVFKICTTSRRSP